MTALDFFAVRGTRASAGLWSRGHVLLLTVTLLLVALGLYLSRRMGAQAVRRTLRVATVTLLALEAVKILFVLLVNGSRDPNDFVPLYYCSIILYAGVFSSFFEGRVRFLGDCFIATAGLVGGAVFLLFPTSTLPHYPAWHLLSLHSFLLHGLMVYLGLLLLLRGVYRPVLRDIVYPAALISVCCAAALAFNLVYDACVQAPVANLMFLSKDFPGTPVSLIYRITGVFFTPFMWVTQAFCPFLAVWCATLAVRHFTRK